MSVASRAASVVGHEAADEFMAAAAALCLVVVCAVLVGWPAADAYEISLYRPYPLLFWAAYALVFVTGILTVLLSVRRQTHYWAYGLTFICLGYVLFHFLPLFRHYWLYGRGGADVLAHIGFAKYIIKTNHATATNNYPFVHIIMTEVTMFTNLPLRISPVVIKAAFIVIYVLGVAGYGQSLSSSSRRATYIAAVTIPFVFGTLLSSFGPSTLSFMLFPLIFLLYEQWTDRRSVSSVKVLTVVFAMLLVIFHPMTTIVLAVLVVASLLPKHVSRNPHIRTVTGAYLASILGVSFFTWHFSFQRTAENIASVIYANLGLVPTTAPAGEQLTAATQSSLTLPQLVFRFIELYGPIFLYSGLATLAILVTAIHARRTGWSYPDMHLSVAFVVATGIAALFMFKYFIVGPERATKYMLLFAPMLIGGFLHDLDQSRFDALVSRRRQALVAAVVVLLILSMLPVALMNAYKPHNHMTYAEHAGTEWLVEERSEFTRAVSQGISHKMILYLEGGGRFFSSHLFGQISGDTIPSRYRLPPDLGGTEQPSITSSIEGEPAYLVTQAHDVNWYRWYPRNQWENKKLYDAEDVDRLHSDEQVNKVYANGGFTVWRTHPSATP